MLQRGEENIEMVLWYGLNDLTANQKLLRFNQSFNKIVKNKSTRTHPNLEIRVSRFRETKWRLKWNAKAKTNKEAITMLRRTFSFPFKEFPGTRTRQQRTVFSLPRHPLLHPPPLTLFHFVSFLNYFWNLLPFLFFSFGFCLLLSAFSVSLSIFLFLFFFQSKNLIIGIAPADLCTEQSYVIIILWHK